MMAKRKFMFAILFIVPLIVTSCGNKTIEELNPISQEEPAEKSHKWDEVYRYNFKNESSLTIDDIYTKAPSLRVGSIDYNIMVGTQSIYPTQNIVASKLMQSGEWFEINAKKNPHYLIFDFMPIPYVEEISNPKNKVSYAIALKKALKSEEWRNSSHKSGLSAEASFKEVKDFSDLNVSFGGNVSVAKVFSANASYEKKKTEYKTVLLARLKASNFKVDTELDGNKVTNDKLVYDSQSYVSSLTYGKIAYLVIFSNYSYDKVKTSINATISSKIASGSANYSRELTNILASSESYCWIKGNTNEESFWGTTPVFINKMFTAVFDKNSIGVPIFFELKFVKSNTLVNPMRDPAGGWVETPIIYITL